MYLQFKCQVLSENKEKKIANVPVTAIFQLVLEEQKTID